MTAAPNIQIEFLPWSVTACPKSWGDHGPSARCDVVLHQEPTPPPVESGWYINVAVDDDLAKVTVEAEFIDGEGQGEEQALRQLLPILEALDLSTLSEKQLATRERAIRLLKERFAS